MSTSQDTQQLFKGAAITGVGAFVPESVITNEDLTKLVETSDEWIKSRTGIEERHVVSGDDSIADLAIGAAKEALASAGIDGSDIDLIIVGCSTHDTIYPAISCQVQHAIGATNAAGFDIALACSGFTYGLIIAQQFLKTGMRKKALVIGADVHSHYVNWYDRNTCVLFGDGSGAAVVEAVDGDDMFIGTDFQIDGSKGMELTLYSSGENCPLVEPKTPVNSHVYMNGREVFKFAVGTVPKSIQKVVDGSGMTMDEIDHVVLHQANIRIMQAMSEKLNIDPDKMVVNLQKYGNTSAASIPIALNEASLDGRLKPGQTVLMCGFGAGLAWATALVKWAVVDRRLPKEQQEAMEAYREKTLAGVR